MGSAFGDWQASGFLLYEWSHNRSGLWLASMSRDSSTEWRILFSIHFCESVVREQPRWTAFIVQRETGSVESRLAWEKGWERDAGGAEPRTALELKALRNFQSDSAGRDEKWRSGAVSLESPWMETDEETKPPLINLHSDFPCWNMLRELIEIVNPSSFCKGCYRCFCSVILHNCELMYWCWELLLWYQTSMASNVHGVNPSDKWWNK